jgi:outer membrane protein OmpU
MKKIILSTVAMSLMSMPVFAADDAGGLDLGVHGYFKSYGVWVDQDYTGTSSLRDFDMIRDMEIHFTGETTLDNGLTVGADVGTDGDQGGSFAVADSFVYFSGDFGRFNVGSTDNVTYLLQVQAPAVDGVYDGMDQYFTPFNYAATNVARLSEIEFDYDQDVSNGGDKISYISPSYSGFQYGVSWTPEQRDTSRGLTGVDTGTGLADILDVAVRFENETSFGSYRIGGGYTAAEERTAWNGAVDLNIGSFGIGAVYTQDNEDEGATSLHTGQTQWILGVDYTVGATTWAASYLNQNNEFTANEIDTDRYTAGASYNVGSGVDFKGVVTFIDHDVDSGLGGDVDGTSAMVGTSIAF